MSFLLSEKVHHFSKITSSNTNCKTTEENCFGSSSCKCKNDDLELQIIHLKDKAHQSFMQVLQIQQLHDEELQQIQKQYEEKENNYQKEIKDLKAQLELVKSEKIALQKNMQRHNCDLNSTDIFLSNIDPISCEQNQNSYLDQSEFSQFQDLVYVKNSNYDLHFLRKEIYKESAFTNTNKQQIDKLFRIIKQLKDDKIFLQKEKEYLQKEKIQTQKTMQNCKNSLQNWKQQSKFLSDHVKKLGNDKLQLEKKIKELSKSRMTQTSSPQPLRLFSPKSNILTHPKNMAMVKSQCLPSQNDFALQKNEVKHFELSKCSNKALFSPKSEINKLGSAKFMMTQLNENRTTLKNSISLKTALQRSP